MSFTPTELLKFFSLKNSRSHNGKTVPYTIGDFIKGKKGIDLNELRRVCKKFEREGLLELAGNRGTPIFGDAYYNMGYDESMAEYGSYDFIANGFLFVRNHFINSVKPLVVTKQDGDLDIGTCFVVSDRHIFTAKHCIENMKTIEIPDSNGASVKANKIGIPEDDMKDFAIVEMDGTPFSDDARLVFSDAQILDDVLTMGYPPISGFEAIQIAEIASINANLKASVGNILGESKSYLDRQSYTLINARVKGGNSGGPLINRYGLVVGMLTRIPADPQDNEKLDLLGYGVALTGGELFELYEKARSGSEDIKTIPFKNLDKGFCTKM